MHHSNFCLRELPWLSSGEDSSLPLQKSKFRSLVWKLRSRMPQGVLPPSLFLPPLAFFFLCVPISGHIGLGVHVLQYDFIITWLHLSISSSVGPPHGEGAPFTGPSRKGERSAERARHITLHRSTVPMKSFQFFSYFRQLSKQFTLDCGALGLEISVSLQLLSCSFINIINRSILSEGFPW